MTVQMLSGTYRTLDLDISEEVLKLTFVISFQYRHLKMAVVFH